MESLNHASRPMRLVGAVVITLLAATARGGESVSAPATTQVTTRVTTQATTRATTLPAAPIFRDSPTSPLAISSQVGVAFRYTIAPMIPRGAPNSTISAYQASGLPAGLAVDTKTGVVAGIPTQAGEFQVALTATNPIGSAGGQLDLTVYPEHSGTATTIMHLKGTTASPFGYVEFLPKNYYIHPEQTFPIVIDLCGAGNIARNPTDPWGDNTQNKLWELSTFAGRTNRTGGTIFDEANCIILSPIPPNWWENVPLDRFFDFAFDHYRVDRRRVYLVGLSAGGDGAMDYIGANGDQIAACVLSAFSHDEARGHQGWTSFKHIPTWIFENWKDPYDGGNDNPNDRHTIKFCNEVAAILSGAVGPTDMLANYPEGDLGATRPTQDYTGIFTVADGWKWSAGINGINGPPLRMTQCKNKGHGGWAQAYSTPEVWKWLFAQRKGNVTSLDGAR